MEQGSTVLTWSSTPPHTPGIQMAEMGKHGVIFFMCLPHWGRLLSKYVLTLVIQFLFISNDMIIIYI